MASRIFFLNLGEEVKKVSVAEFELDGLYDIFRSRFESNGRAASASDANISFTMKDKEFSVVAKLDNFQEIYPGAVVICKVKHDAPSNCGSLRADIETAKRKLSVLQTHVGQKRGRGSEDGSSKRYIVRIRGLPWHSTVEDIKEFFSGVGIIQGGISLVEKLGRSSGEAFVEVENESEFRNALGKDRNHLGSRYIEVYRATVSEAERGGLGIQGTAKKAIPVSPHSLILRLRGLPYSATEVDVFAFLEGVTPVAVHFPTDHLGRPSGDCYVEVTDEVDQRRALARSKHNMGDRYIDVLKSDSIQLRQTMGIPMDASSIPAQMVNSTGQRCVRMQGLPWGTEEKDINMFFQAAGVIPTCIHRKVDGSEAYCEFVNAQEASTAMTRNRSFIGSRYIELFYVDYNSMADEIGLPREPVNQTQQYGGFNNFAGARQVGAGDRFGGSYPPQMGAGARYGNGASYGANSYGGNTWGHTNNAGGQAGEGPVVKLRGLPWSVTPSDIMEFFRGFSFLSNSIILGKESSGRPDGQAYVTFSNTQAAQSAISAKNRQFIGGRYIELSLNQ